MFGQAKLNVTFIPEAWLGVHIGLDGGVIPVVSATREPAAKPSQRSNFELSIFSAIPKEGFREIHCNLQNSTRSISSCIQNSEYIRSLFVKNKPIHQHVFTATGCPRARAVAVLCFKKSNVFRNSQRTPGENKEKFEKIVECANPKMRSP